MKRNQAGFTLMEILLVSTLIATISIAIFSVLNNGMKLWKRGMLVDNKGEMFIGMEKISQDLRSTLPFSLIHFQGSSQKLSFAALVTSAPDPKGTQAQDGLIEQIGAVEYRFEPGEGKIFRRQANYGQAMKQQWGQEYAIASGLKEAHFDYYVDGIKKLETASHVESQIPAGVMLTMQVGDNGQQLLQRYFEIPVGGQ